MWYQDGSMLFYLVTKHAWDRRTDVRTERQTDRRTTKITIPKTALTELLRVVIQEAPLTLRGQRGRCRNIKGYPKYMRASLTQGQAHFFLGVVFMVVLGQPQLHAKFEVASFSHCVNIEVEPQNLGSSPSPRPRPIFLRVWFYDGPWQTQAVNQIWSH